ncbi:hypothetical protein A3D03_02220 [Candidatus Gottesmanbacteria bacterium RIFCSPHIGHO2_02_FULL_40_13]|uniref:Glutathione synthetase n=1 Tax=Candidatus Gottesmanbacteria bacterium RIFCSPHIGHO2_02_FULL_40_13 TaxID=1798384 RepID=A0A1F6A782_9BACT|nr:MAG: hypothetical protein A3D03_02220 [Candidatus Gottesmanbacteria bacterium RIFCSPHIGHO2_02_FULL_40_13]
MDKSVYLLVVAGITANIPQLTKIWGEKNTAGVSLITWLGFLTGSLFWLSYGLIHKEKPIIISNFFFVLIQLFIVLGLILNNNAL